jgi:hypothetical protein
MMYLSKQGKHVLNMNFSVLVNMYSELVTSYWYRLRSNQARSGRDFEAGSRKGRSMTLPIMVSSTVVVFMKPDD